MHRTDKTIKGKIPYEFGEEIRPYSRKKSYLLCPECGQPVKLQCLCPIQDSVCENGHKWHMAMQKNKKVVVKGEGVH
jgi:hypothetical protein